MSHPLSLFTVDSVFRIQSASFTFSTASAFVPVDHLRTHPVEPVALHNRQLAKLLSGFVTGQITVAKVVVILAAQSPAWGK